MSPLGRLLRHWELKLLSIVFAVVLWVFVGSEDTGEAIYTVPVEVTGVPAGMVVTALGAETVDVRVQGLRYVLAQLEERSLRADLNLRQARPGEVVVSIRPEDVPVPRGVQVVRVTPSRVRATLEPASRPKAGRK
ncbi:MAG TPA: CdaR family protein [Methylomirabilota bacterium]|jgi:YbbR domain-containing protein|nr:CdaR family protein [Methylomirabilota bacterium]